MPSTSSTRPRRLTVRARLALTYALLVTLAGVTLMAVVAVYFGVVPNYTFGGATETLPSGSGPLTIEVSPPGDDSSLIMPTGIAVTIGSRSDMVQRQIGRENSLGAQVEEIAEPEPHLGQAFG